jgi:hypothetical protein
MEVNSISVKICNKHHSDLKMESIEVNHSKLLEFDGVLEELVSRVKGLRMKIMEISKNYF